MLPRMTNLLPLRPGNTTAGLKMTKINGLSGNIRRVLRHE